MPHGSGPDFVGAPPRRRLRLAAGTTDEFRLFEADHDLALLQCLGTGGIRSAACPRPSQQVSGGSEGAVGSPAMGAGSPSTLSWGGPFPSGVRARSLAPGSALGTTGESDADPLCLAWPAGLVAAWGPQRG